MIPRSIWRWMTLDIKRKKKEKRIQLIGGLIGFCVAVVSLFYFFHIEKAEAEKRMVEIVNYVKVQCSTYTHYNESSESKSLLRSIESARQMSTNINMEIENGGQLSQEFLKENLQTLWVDGIIVLDTEGKTDCKYSTDEALANEITEYLQKEIIMDFAGIVGWKRVIAVDQASINILHKKVPLSATSFYMYAGKGGNIL